MRTVSRARGFRIMPVQVDPIQFETAHQAFLAHMLKQGGKPFTSFNNEFLWNDEIAYKIRIHQEASEALHLAQWPHWRKHRGKIFQAVTQACSPRISRNLLEHRYGGQRP